MTQSGKEDPHVRICTDVEESGIAKKYAPRLTLKRPWTLGSADAAAARDRLDIVFCEPRNVEEFPCCGVRPRILRKLSIVCR